MREAFALSYTELTQLSPLLFASGQRTIVVAGIARHLFTHPGRQVEGLVFAPELQLRQAESLEMTRKEVDLPRMPVVGDGGSASSSDGALRTAREVPRIRQRYLIFVLITRPAPWHRRASSA